MCLLLDIESKAKSKSSTFSRQFKNGKSLGVFESDENRPCVGTTVTVCDLFHCLPVRQKALNVPMELERCRHRMEALALIHHNLSFSLRNDATGQIVLQTHKTNSMLGSFTQLFGANKARHLCEVTDNSNPLFSINGYLSTVGCSTKTYQFVYINKRLVLQTKLHRTINFWLSRSQIGKTRGVFQGNSKLSGSPQKQKEKQGIYMINITSPLSEYDITFDPTKTLVEFKAWSSLLESVTTTVRTFLQQENLVNREDGFSSSSSSSSSSDEDSSDLPSSLDTSDVEDSAPAATTTEPRKYAAAISALDIEHSLHSKVARRRHRPPATNDHREDLEDLLSTDNNTQHNHPVSTPVIVPETQQSDGCPPPDTMDIRLSQYTLPTNKNTTQWKSQSQTDSANSNNKTEEKSSNGTKDTTDSCNVFKTPENPIPSLTVSQLLPTLTQRNTDYQGVRDRTFVSLPSSDEGGEIKTPHKQNIISIEAFKAAFNQTKPPETEEQPTLTPLQKMRQHILARAQRLKQSQGRNSF